MHPITPPELQEALRPIASFLSKSEKAMQKVPPGSWQHTMLRENVAALQIASALMNRLPGEMVHFKCDHLQKALTALGSMIGRTGKAQARFEPGTSQHTLLQNRLKALQHAEVLMKMEACRAPSGRP